MWQSHILLFFLFSPFSSFSCTPRPPAILGSGISGAGRTSQKDRELPLRLEGWSQSGGKSHCFRFAPLLFCCLALMWAWLWEVYGRMGLMKLSFLQEGWKRKPRNQRIAGEWGSLGKWPLKLLTDCWADTKLCVLECDPEQHIEDQIMG